jgi:uncharacterized membrane protein YeaQ/YmgE (transglycosylase-associated protein family)
MQGVGVVMMLAVGALAGWIAEKLTRSDHGLLATMVIGIAGAFIGGFLAGLAGVPVRGVSGMLVAAVLGAAVLIVIFRAATGRRARS